MPEEIINITIVESNETITVSIADFVQISKHSELSLDDGTNPHGTTKTDVGLSNVDNTSDVNKPISNATQTSLNAKLDKDFSVLPDADLPLNDTDKIIVSQGGMPKKANKSDFGGGGAVTPESLYSDGGILYYQEFLCILAANLNDGKFTYSTSGGSLASSTDTGVTPPKGNVLQYTTLTSATSLLSVRTNSVGQFLTGQGIEFITSVRIGTLSNATDNAVFTFGAFSDTVSVNVGNGWGIMYDRYGESDLATASPNWLLFTKNGGSFTVVDTGIAVTNTDYFKLKVVKAVDNSSITMYINDVAFTPITTNIVADNSVTTPCMKFRKTLGTNAIVLRSDILILGLNK